ncbi:MAG: indole-3-glycerol phosphate synthase TrpC [Prevotellaceae bacterium]|jgi:indole-3-glycerol phosphate synthase|nr:indole-3-glycerol phosphate synthase TrpC [Prevotellaceae bacterium]
MNNILEKIVADKRVEVAQRKAVRTIAQLTKESNFERKTLSLKSSLRQSQSGIIAEFKRKSPSKGWIHANADLPSVTAGYSAAGASGISILTDEKYFGGTPNDLIAARPQVACPILRKDFTVDEYQIYEAKAMGADLVLLIAAALSVKETKAFASKAHELGLEVLLEVHSEEELAHANEFVDMLGVNNRNLKTFTTDVQISFDLADKIPADFVKVSESGISQPQTVLELRRAGFQGFLMGENFMKEKNPAQALSNFIGQVK